MTYAQMVEQMKLETAAIQDEDERLFKQAEWNIKIIEQWGKERTEANAMTIEEIREKFVGKKSLFSSDLNGMHYRKVQEDENGFFIKWFGDLMEVEYNPIFKKMDIKRRK